MRTRPHVDGRSERVLVTGGAGYIGSLLCRELIRGGYRVRVLDNMRFGSQAVTALAGDDDFELIEGDCRDTNLMHDALENVQHVVHLAAIVGDQACATDCQTAIAVNYGATRALAEAARERGVSRFVFASSCSAYGASDHLMQEDSTVNPLSVYALTKVAAEEAVLRMHADGFHPVVLRLATVFGWSYRPRFDLVVNLLAANACKTGVITIYNGCQWRPFIHVRDISNAVLSVLNADANEVRREVFNVGDSRMNYTLRDVAEAVRRRVPNTTIQYIDNEDRRNYRVSFEKIRNRIGFECTIALDTGIEELCCRLAPAAHAETTAGGNHRNGHGNGVIHGSAHITAEKVDGAIAANGS